MRRNHPWINTRRNLSIISLGNVREKKKILINFLSKIGGLYLMSSQGKEKGATGKGATDSESKDGTVSKK